MFCLYLTTGGCYIKLEVIDSSGRNFCRRNFLLSIVLPTLGERPSMALCLSVSSSLVAQESRLIREEDTSQERDINLFLSHIVSTPKPVYTFLFVHGMRLWLTDNIIKEAAGCSIFYLDLKQWKSYLMIKNSDRNYICRCTAMSLWYLQPML